MVLTKVERKIQIETVFLFCSPSSQLIPNSNIFLKSNGLRSIVKLNFIHNIDDDDMKTNILICMLVTLPWLSSHAEVNISPQNDLQKSFEEFQEDEDVEHLMENVGRISNNPDLSREDHQSLNALHSTLSNFISMSKLKAASLPAGGNSISDVLSFNELQKDQQSFHVTNRIISVLKKVSAQVTASQSENFQKRKLVSHFDRSSVALQKKSRPDTYLAVMPLANLDKSLTGDTATEPQATLPKEESSKAFSSNRIVAVQNSKISADVIKPQKLKSPPEVELQRKFKVPEWLKRQAYGVAGSHSSLFENASRAYQRHSKSLHPLM